ncbi:MAG: hypothetical protein V2I46_14805 [Bacteroides sp.]|jgi:hypothetical protein|nr:hypothetical protein [Bacteroides sp.]
MKSQLVVWDNVGWFFGLVFLFIGLVNTFWGNDPFFGVFIVLLSLVFFPPVNVILKEWTGFSIHYRIKILLGLFILWAALGVGELFNKINMMLMEIF